MTYQLLPDFRSAKNYLAGGLAPLDLSSVTNRETSPDELQVCGLILLT